MKSERITIRLTAEELEQFEKRSSELDMSTSSFFRFAGQRALNETLLPEKTIQRILHRILCANSVRNDKDLQKFIKEELNGIRRDS